jgi:hypothetical protein
MWNNIFMESKDIKDKLKDIELDKPVLKPVIQRSLGYQAPESKTRAAKKHIKNKTIRINKHI